MAYEILDVETGNAQGVWPSLLEALQFVRDAVERLGPETVGDLVLYESLPDDEIRPIAEGHQLLPMIGVHPSTAQEKRA